MTSNKLTAFLFVVYFSTVLSPATSKSSINLHKARRDDPSDAKAEAEKACGPDMLAAADEAYRELLDFRTHIDLTTPAQDSEEGKELIRNSATYKFAAKNCGWANYVANLPGAASASSSTVSESAPAEISSAVGSETAPSSTASGDSSSSAVPTPSALQSSLDRTKSKTEAPSSITSLPSASPSSNGEVAALPHFAAAGLLGLSIYLVV